MFDDKIAINLRDFHVLNVCNEFQCGLETHSWLQIWDFWFRVSAEEHEISRVKKSVTKKQAANKCLHTKISCHSSKVEKEARWCSTFRQAEPRLNLIFSHSSLRSSFLCGDYCCSARKSNPSPDRVISTSRFLPPKKLYMHKKHE